MYDAVSSSIKFFLEEMLIRENNTIVTGQKDDINSE